MHALSSTRKRKSQSSQSSDIGSLWKFTSLVGLCFERKMGHSLPFCDFVCLGFVLFHIDEDKIRLLRPLPSLHSHSHDATAKRLYPRCHARCGVLQLMPVYRSSQNSYTNSSFPLLSPVFAPSFAFSNIPITLFSLTIFRLSCLGPV